MVAKIFHFLIIFSLLTFNAVVGAQQLTIGSVDFVKENNYLNGQTSLDKFLQAATSLGLTKLVAVSAHKVDFNLALADRIQVSENQKEWTFRLRKGVTFVNDQEISRFDVKASLDWCLEDSKTNFSKVVESVSTINKTEEDNSNRDWIIIKLKSPDANLPIELAHCPIVHKLSKLSFAKDWGYGSNFVSAGAYQVGDFKSGNSYTLLRFERYPGKKAANDAIILRSFPTEENALLALRVGTIDLFFSSNPVVLERAAKDETLKISSCFGEKVVLRKGLIFSCEPVLMFDKIKYAI